MNAVEAVEQLEAMGRKLQAHEVGLQQPSLRLQRALRQSADWETMLGDPVAALSQLLGAAGGGPVRAKEAAGEPEALVSTSPLAPFRWEEDRPPAGSGISTGRSVYTSGQSGDPGSGSGPAGGMRLARRQTSLLGILNANLEDRVHGGMGERGRAAALTGDAHLERRPAVRDEDAADLSAPVARWSAAPSSFAPQDEMRQSSGQAARLTGGSQQDEPYYGDQGVASVTRQGIVGDRLDGGHDAVVGAAGSSLPAVGDVPTGINVRGFESLPFYGPEGVMRTQERLGPESRLELAHGTASGMPAVHGEEPNPTFASASPVVPQSQPRPDGPAGDWNGWQQHTDVAPMQGGVWAPADGRQEERPLSMAQIEQVLSALDERLELILLRMYGSAGGLP